MVAPMWPGVGIANCTGVFRISVLNGCSNDLNQNSAKLWTVYSFFLRFETLGNEV